MYGFKQHIELNAEEILARATQKEIFNLFIKDDIIPREEGGGFYTAPYRDDLTPKCYFEMLGNTLVFVDFTLEFHNLDCFNMVQECLNCNFIEALQYIDRALDLGISYGTTLKEVKYKVERKSQSSYKPISRDRKIYTSRRAFRPQDAKYWTKYEITMSQLQEDKVFPVTTFRGTNRAGEVYTISPFDITYSYNEFLSGNIKIYRPLAQAPNPKFLTNCNQDDVFNENNFPLEGEKAVITKSYKDCRVLRNMEIINAVGFQNEGMVPSEAKLKKLFQNYKTLVIWFDCDQAGLGASIRVKERLQEVFPDKMIEIISLPVQYLDKGIKDPADMVDKGYKLELIEFINNKKLI